jgi:two-component sensor histidine kinase
MSASDQNTPGGGDPVVEPAREDAHEETGAAALMLRIRQQELLAELGVVALQQPGFKELLARTVEFVAEGLQAEFCKVLEYMPHDNRLLLRAGVGWEPDLIGVASVGADLDSPSGFALRTGKPVISNHLAREDRFRTPALLEQHGVRRAMNVILQGDGAPFGVREVDSKSPGEFSERDLAFLQGAANIVGMALERERYQRQLQNALDHHKVLLREINHRVRNSLQLVIVQLTLQARATDDEVLARHLEEAVGRVAAVARVHEQLYRSSDILTVDLAAYLADVSRDLAKFIPEIHFCYDQDRPLRMSTDRAVRVALLATELVTNAAKHAQGTERPLRIEMFLSLIGGNRVQLTVKDNGPGVPHDFTPERSSGLGMRILTILIKQLGADMTIRHHQPGSEFIIQFPLAETPERAS